MKWCDRYFSEISISQGSVATCLRWDGIFGYLMTACKFPADYDTERILKIGQYLMKLCLEY